MPITAKLTIVATTSWKNVPNTRMTQAIAPDSTSARVGMRVAGDITDSQALPMIMPSRA